MPLSEHVYCVATAFKVTEWVEQGICVKFCIKLEHSSAETIWMNQKATAIGNWWLAASSWQHACSCITSYVEILEKQPWVGTMWLLAFSQTKITFEREEILDHWWDSGKYDRAADGNWENCVRSQGASSEEDWGVIVSCAMFLVSFIFFNKCLYFL